MSTVQDGTRHSTYRHGKWLCVLSSLRVQTPSFYSPRQILYPQALRKCVGSSPQEVLLRGPRDLSSLSTSVPTRGWPILPRVVTETEVTRKTSKDGGFGQDFQPSLSSLEYHTSCLRTCTTHVTFTLDSLPLRLTYPTEDKSGTEDLQTKVSRTGKPFTLSTNQTPLTPDLTSLGSTPTETEPWVVT